MSNVKKFFSNDVELENNQDFIQSKENEAIEIKLIKQKSQGLISGYSYNYYRNLWNIRGVNGVECYCQLNENAECFGDIRFSYKGQSVRKYFSINEHLANAFGNVFDELNRMYQEELKEIELKKQEELNKNSFDMSMDLLAVA